MNKNQDASEATPIWTVDITLESLKERGRHTLAEHMGIEFTEIGNNFLIAKMPVDERTIQPLGRLHGGASCALAETVGSVAANCCIDLKQSFAVGLEINANHVKAATAGFVYGKASPLHLGKTTQIWNIDITTEEGALVCISRLTMAVLQRK